MMTPKKKKRDTVRGRVEKTGQEQLKTLVRASVHRSLYVPVLKATASTSSPEPKASESQEDPDKARKVAMSIFFFGGGSV